MNLTQISLHRDKPCGVGFFSLNLHATMEQYGIKTKTITELKPVENTNIYLVQYLKKINLKNIVEFQQKVKKPIVLFVHFNHDLKDNKTFPCITLSPNTQCGNCKKLVINHPVYVGPKLDKNELKKAKNLDGKIVIGTNGFINDKRRFDEIAKFLLDNLDERYILNMLCTKHHDWNFPNIEKNLRYLASTGRVLLNTKMLTHQELNKNLQMCDILWCWTDTIYKDYASGVAADHYGSGTKMVLPFSVAHQYLKNRQNVIFTQNNLQDFLNSLLLEIKKEEFTTHDPNDLSWAAIGSDIVKFLKSLVAKKLL